MSNVDILYDDFIRVEESHLNRWRVHNGKTWAHGFRTKERAIEFAERVGGTRVAFCKKIQGKVHYVRAEKVETKKEQEDDK